MFLSMKCRNSSFFADGKMLKKGSANVIKAARKAYFNRLKIASNKVSSSKGLESTAFMPASK